MSEQMIVVGDTTTHGGTVISGSPTSRINGRPIARLGDLVSCPQCYADGRPHGINPIVQVAGRYKVDGIPGACAGDLTECGCALIGSHEARA